MKNLKQNKNKHAITINQDVRFGKPVIKGTRIAIADMLSLLEAGYRIDEIPKQYTHVSLAQAKQAICYKYP